MEACTDHNQCIADAMETAEKICKDRGLRFTELRRKILEMIWNNHGPVKAYDLIANLNDDHSPAKPPTVYRTLEFLLENGLIHKLNSLNAYVGCAHPLRHDECYFLICTSCQTVMECCNHTLAEAISDTMHENAFNPKHVTLEIEGKCAECKNKEARRASA